MISVFEMFSIGIGPSSSHTVGPMRAARDFLVTCQDELTQIKHLTVTLYGSLAFTGQGHGTDKAILMGLEGYEPESINPDMVSPRAHEILKDHQIKLLNQYAIPFNPLEDIIFNYQEVLDYHPNGMRFCAYDASKNLIKEANYFSIGGGFIVNMAQLPSKNTQEQVIPFPFESAADLLEHAKKNNLSIAQVLMQNERVNYSDAEIHSRLLHIADVMEKCIKRGYESKEKTLPGALQVRRRAPELYQKLIKLGKPSPHHPQVMQWLNVFALAVNEENAAGGRVVTAPTNGAAGIIPAVLNYYKDFCDGNEQGVIDFLLTAGAIGILYKKNASISGAEMGCQGEVGVACSMAAGGLAAALGGSIYQVENAAEVGMEHNLGLTCDPVGGLVQIPCIERNAMGAIKAVNAAQLALAEDGQHKVSLDMVIATMREIGKNMNSIYKETSRGGLAVAVNVSEC